MTHPPADVVALADERVQARAAKDWARSDELRDRIASRSEEHTSELQSH